MNYDLTKIEFKGSKKYLSNMYQCEIVFDKSTEHFEADGLTYPSSEHLYQSLKCRDKNWTKQLLNVSPHETKIMARKMLVDDEFIGFRLREDWDSVKIEAMELCIDLKFGQNSRLAGMLLKEDTFIEERNCWGDTFWGTVDGVGENNLGKLLMKMKRHLESFEGFRFAVVGSRGFDNFELFVKIMDKLRKTKGISAIISGGAKGVDSMAEHYADVNNIPCVVHEAQWDKFGKSAGFIRNNDIWDDSEIGIAIWDGISKGTRHSFDIASKQRKKLFIFNYSINGWVNEKGEKYE